MKTLNLVIVVPQLLVSSVLALMVLAVLPPSVGLLLLLTVAALQTALALGALEGPAVQLLARARMPTHRERTVLAPVLTRLGGLGVGTKALYVRRSPRTHMPPAVAIGRSSIVVTPWLIEATYRGTITHDEAAAVIAHAEGRHRAEQHRFELAVLAWTTPWRMVAAVARRIAAVFAWFPLMRTAWALRGLVGAVCVVQSATQGRTVYGLIAGAFVALTYLVPAAARRQERRAESAADQFLVELGLSVHMASLLRRLQQPLPLDRLPLLESPVPAPSTNARALKGERHRDLHRPGRLGLRVKWTRVESPRSAVHISRNGHSGGIDPSVRKGRRMLEVVHGDSQSNPTGELRRWRSGRSRCPHAPHATRVAASLPTVNQTG
ncbi:MAG: hypothetical protein GEU93_14240 [Propionibacteriales bacterium]|nr:hypothetical protein [Propionibacteriales bacterium]